MPDEQETVRDFLAAVAETKADYYGLNEEQKARFFKHGTGGVFNSSVDDMRKLTGKPPIVRHAFEQMLEEKKKVPQ